MQGVIKRRREYLQLMRSCTLEQGSFTVTDIQEASGVPRSTAQDWINRLIDEGCVVLRERKQGRIPARYAATSAMPQSACRKIFTTIDGDRVEIYHECLSGACAAFCGHHHVLAGGVITGVRRDGTLLRECAVIGRNEIDIGLHPASAVGVAGVEREGDDIIQYIRCIGGPAYSLTDMMAHAEGVQDVTVSRRGGVVEGKVRTRALCHVVIGLDDTDSREGGATFALSLALLQHLCTFDGVFPIGHYVAMLFPKLEGKTTGNSCSYIELAIDPGLCHRISEKALLFVNDEALSPEWGMAIKKGFFIPEELRDFGRQARREVVDIELARQTAGKFDVTLHGKRGVIGALAAVALSGLPNEILLNPDLAVPVL